MGEYERQSSSKMALATTSKVFGRNIVKSWLPLVAQQRSISDRKNSPKVYQWPKWWHEISPEFKFRPGYWKYISPPPYHEGDDDPTGLHYTRYRQTTIPQSKAMVNKGEVMMILIWWWILFNMLTDWGHIVGDMKWIDPLDFTDEELGIPKEE